MILGVPLNATPAQEFEVLIERQYCMIRLVWRNDKLYCDLSIEGTAIWTGLIVHDRTPMKSFRVTPFVGNFVFVDHDGTNDPHYAELGERYRMYYISDDEKLLDSYQIRGTEV